VTWLSSGQIKQNRQGLDTLIYIYIYMAYTVAKSKTEFNLCATFQ